MFLEGVTHENDEYKFRDVKLKPPTVNADQFKRKQKILIESVLNHINKRIGDLDTNHLLRFMQIFYPANKPVTEAEEAVKTYELFAGVLNRFECDIDHLKQTELPALKVRMKRDGNNTSVQDFYRRLFTNPNQKETLKNILVLGRDYSLHPCVF